MPKKSCYVNIYEKSTKRASELKFVKTSDSFVKNFFSFIVTSYYGITSPNLVDTSGVSRALSLAGLLPMCAAAADGSYGLQVGTGSAENVYDEYCLNSQIVSGALSGQLYYGSTKVSVPVVAGNEISFSVMRTFLNFSDVSIPITELALTGKSGYSIMVLRDVISPAIDIPAGEGKTIYTVVKTTI